MADPPSDVLRQDDVWAVVLAGGTGTRLWPASRPERPKQLLPLSSDGRPLVAEAVDRAIRVAGRERVRLVANGALLEVLEERLPELEEENFLAEPEARGTAPALLWAAHRIGRRDRDVVMLSLHADHRIQTAAAFEETAARTVAAARNGGRLYCIGARPTRPETGYGYVALGEPLGEGIHQVREFVEKPNRHWARRYVDSGEYLWNTGLFAWRVGDFLAATRTLAPELEAGMVRLDRDPDDARGFFDAVDPVSVDVAVMERADSVGVVEATFDWDDLGVWTAVGRALQTDGSGNAVMGESVRLDASDNIVWSENGRLVLFGVEGLVVVQSGGQTLVTTRERAPDLKRLLRSLEGDAEE